MVDEHSGQPGLAGAVIAEMGRIVPGAEYRDGVLHIDGEGVAEAVRRIDADGQVHRAPRRERRTLATGGNAEARAAIPGEHRFVDRDGVQTDYLAGPDIARIANALINTDDDLAFLEGVKIHYLWRRKGRKKAGRAVLGTCQKLSGLARYGLGGGEFLIILDAENCELLGLSAWQLEALVYHELNHIAPPEEDEEAAGPTLVGHDAELFNAEIRRYGLWKADLRIASKAFGDLPLFAGLSEE
jgi:hypothetical protein